MKPLLFLVLLVQASLTYSADLNVAVAASFLSTFKQLSAVFQQQTGTTLNASSASSGQLFAQIKHGASYDIFFSADALRPQQLLRESIGIGPTQIYALGQLALYSQPAIICDNWQKILRLSKAEDIALANPALAPFGLAATQVLATTNISNRGMPQASNAAIPLNWLYSGSIRHALSALSFAHKMPSAVSVCALPSQLHKPIEQHLLRLNTRPETLALIRFINSETAINILRTNGYNGRHDN